jgi:cytochrome c2
VSRDWLFSFLKDPFRDHPETLMVHYRFSDDEIRDLVAYLTEELVDPDAPTTPPQAGYLDPKLVEAGRATFVKHGCYSCHRFSGMEMLGKIGPSLEAIGDRVVEPSDFEGQNVEPTLPNWLFVKLMTPDKLAQPSRMPTFNFSEEQAAAITVALLSIRGTDLPASRVTSEPQPAPYTPQGTFGALVERYRCLSCHQVHGWGGTISTVPLDRVGSQLQRDYISSYLQNPSAVRVSVEARMPHFNMTSGEAKMIADYLSRVFVDDSLEQASPRGASVQRGSRLYDTLGCRGCHIVGGQGGYVGPDLSDSARRLKPGWVAAWLRKPQRWKPGTLQPDYGLSAEDAQDLAAFVTSLSAGGRGLP